MFPFQKITLTERQLALNENGNKIIKNVSDFVIVLTAVKPFSRIVYELF